jgi:uncharacterized membrane protein HdeD (DUF308 family)
MTFQTSPTSLATPSLLHSLTDHWWLFLIRGIAAIIFGILAFAWPGVTLVVLVLFFGAFALVDGIASLIAAITGRGATAPRWWLAIIGLVGIAAGLLTFFWPAVTAVLLLYFIAGWAIAMGVFQIIGAIQLRKEIDNEWLLVLSGVVSVLFGILLLAVPGTGLLALIWLIAIDAIIFGVLVIGFGLRLRKHKTAAATVA